MLGAVEMVKSPDHDGNLASHVIDIVLHFEPVACLAERPGKCITDDRVPDMSYMERTIRVGTRMF